MIAQNEVKTSNQMSCIYKQSGFNLIYFREMQQLVWKLGVRLLHKYRASDRNYSLG